MKPQLGLHKTKQSGLPVHVACLPCCPSRPAEVSAEEAVPVKAAACCTFDGINRQIPPAKKPAERRCLDEP